MMSDTLTYHKVSDELQVKHYRDAYFLLDLNLADLSRKESYSYRTNYSILMSTNMKSYSRLKGFIQIFVINLKIR